MNEQDIINRLTRIEAVLDEVVKRLRADAVKQYPTQPLKPHNWPWGYSTHVGAVGSTSVMECPPGAVGSAENPLIVKDR
jgi:hypothetical protein